MFEDDCLEYYNRYSCIYVKACAVVDSCTTLEQLKSAKRYVELAILEIQQYKHLNGLDLDKRLNQKLEDKQKEIHG